ncbi:mitochondrial FAD carrier protein flx1 [Malassezia vespertilionis]|uniref:Uncharacterized protein n=1 Tax=Malassezia vespertilionis TaxID=2020962 RepID=A0A2N1JC07_9BASI|nr:mitochondrial FAD carrier protein flx1 [Malassezia vespertilionis]PKI84076.1 hypothetical protein MVES_002029 [Malassezia vespertilionis]WFD06797.1 mitochondrial FAD carrier protein flx1 [Malassezia vespertilionis]
MSAKTEQPLSFFANPALDHAFAGTTAGVIGTLCMNPMDLVKTRFQVNTSAFSSDPALRSACYQRIHSRPWLFYLMGGKPGADIFDAMHSIVDKQGWGGLYRGVVPNIVGNASSWGFYFLWYTMIKEYMASSSVVDQPVRLSATDHLLAATESGVITALMTNPIWVVKTRMFTTPLESTALKTTQQGSTAPEAYRGLWHGLVRTVQTEGICGLYRGVGLAVLGVSNGAVQFMAYEQLKQWRTGRELRRRGIKGQLSEAQLDSVKLCNFEYTVISGAAKLVAITLTYPYQVVRSRMQNYVTNHLYPNTWTCVVKTFQAEGVRGFYRGFAMNALRILPGTCVTFVAYENVSWALRRAAAAREDALHP